MVKNILKLKRGVHLHLLKWILFNEAKLGSTRDSDVTELANNIDVMTGRNCFSSILILVVCYYHVTYAFHSEYTLYSCLNVKELLARDRRRILRLSESDGIQTQNHLVCKRTLNHLLSKTDHFG